MRAFWTWLATIASSDEEIQRRGQNLLVIALGIAILSLLFMPVVLLTPGSSNGISILVAAEILTLSSIALARRGAVWQGSALLVIAATGSVLLALLDTPHLTTPFYLTLTIGIASATLRPAQIWAVWGVVAAGLLGTAALNRSLFFADAQGLQSLLGALLVLAALALMGSLGARGVERALGRARAESRRAQKASHALEEANASLEEAVEARTRELGLALELQQTAAASLQASLDAQQRLNNLVTELSLPIIPVRDDVLVAPLIGNLDSERASQLLDSVLREVQQRRAKALVLDITGVPVVDTHTAHAIMRVARATNLLGAQTILVGIRPEVAQALVTLGVALETIRTAATLQEGLTLVRS